MVRPPKVPGKADNWQICLFCWKSAALFSPFFVIFSSRILGGWKFQGKPEILFQKYVLVWFDPRKCQGRQIIGKYVFLGGKAPRFFHRFLSFFRLEWRLGGWQFQGKPEILFQKYVLVWLDPWKCQGRQIIDKYVFFCGTLLPFGRHFLDSNSTYQAENFTLYSKFNSKNSFYYDRTPKNAWGSQKWQISFNHPDLASHSQVLLPNSFKLKTLEQNALKQT